MGKLLCFFGSIKEVLYFWEFGWVRVFVDLMLVQYLLENYILVDFYLFVCFESFRKDGINDFCLYVFYFCDWIYFWIFKKNGFLYF